MTEYLKMGKFVQYLNGLLVAFDGTNSFKPLNSQSLNVSAAVGEVAHAKSAHGVVSTREQDAVCPKS
jgi:hypothetical protein